jgi:hypothetical protein
MDLLPVIQLLSMGTFLTPGKNQVQALTLHPELIAGPKRLPIFGPHG